MAKNKHSHHREMPHAHLYHVAIPIIFVFIWSLDSFFFKLTLWLNEIVMLWIRVLLFIVILSVALAFIYLSHKAIFKESHEASNVLITDGILGHVRNPMYLGIMLIYLSLIMFSMSIISMVVIILSFFVYNKMANFEAKILEQMFGDEYLAYKNRVPKWISSLKKKL